MSDEVSVYHNRNHSRFEVRQNEGVAFTEYTLDGDEMTFVHTYVPKELEGHGLAAKVVAAGLAYAREHKLRVVPKCPYVASYLKRHPEYDDLLDPEYRTK